MNTENQPDAEQNDSQSMEKERLHSSDGEKKQSASRIVHLSSRKHAIPSDAGRPDSHNPFSFDTNSITREPVPKSDIPENHIGQNSTDRVCEHKKEDLP